MTGAQHYQAAERALTRAESTGDADDLVQAQAEATLALAAAVFDGAGMNLGYGAERISEWIRTLNGGEEPA